MTKGTKISICAIAIALALINGAFNYNLNKEKSEKIIQQPIISMDFDDIFTPSDNNIGKTK